MAPYRVVLAIVEPRHPGQAGDFGEYVEQIVTVRVGRSGTKVERLPIRGARVAFTRSGNQRRVDQAVVFHEAHEYAAEQPRDRGLGQRTGAPDAERVAGAFGVPRGPVLRLQGGFHLRNALGTLGEIPFELLQLSAQIGQKILAVDHRRRRFEGRGWEPRLVAGNPLAGSGLEPFSLGCSRASVRGETPAGRQSAARLDKRSGTRVVLS